MEDHELLREYAEHQSDKAFAELVARHIDLVYSTAFRLLGEPHLAKDVAQMVFIGLARKPRSIRNPQALAGWLYRTTRFTAGSTLRTEHRRRRWESAAMELNNHHSDSQSVWQALAPYLEAAIDTLDAADQDAVALRFFEGKSLREVGAALRMTEDAAQKRVARALEKLRSCFARQGIAASSTLIASVIAAHAVQAAPAGLAASVASASLAGAAGGGAATFTLKLIEIMAATKLKFAAAALIIAAAVSTPIILSQKTTSPKPREPAEPAEIANSKPPETAVSIAAEPRLQASNATNAPAIQSPYQRLSEFIESHHELAREEIEAYLQQNKRNAESLLAAFRVSQDKSYLREAATNFPNSPAVQFAVTANNVFPDDQRKWIDAFKATSPDNALAWYFSALDYFRLKQPDLAIHELAEATRRQTYDAYAAQTSQAVEEMYGLAGWPPLAAKAWAPSSAPLSYLTILKNLANEMMQTQQQYLNQGDAASANSMASMGMVLGGQLRAADGLINQLTGIAVEKKILGQLDPAVNYDFLGHPVSEMLAEADQQKQALSEALRLRDQALPTLNETELANYFERKKLYGEVGALQWLQSKHGQP
jgi:RNA polymerase sigma factor (sigma-70 family)